MNAQPSLFDPPTHRDGPLTEKIAALWMKRKSGRLRLHILVEMQRRGEKGLTRQEIDRLYNTTPNVSQPRLWELQGNGKFEQFAVPTKRKRRLTPESCPATVWVALEYATEEERAA